MDRMGMCASALCIVHCITIPFLFIFGFESMLAIFDQEFVELGLIGIALIVGAVSFAGGFLIHKQHFIPVLFISGFLLLVSGESVSESWLSLILSVSGALVILYAHLQNLKWRNYATND